MTDVYPPASRADAIVDIPVPFTRAGTWHAKIRARLVDDDGDGSFEVGYNTGVAENRIRTFPAKWVRRPKLTDLHGIVPRDVLARMRGEAFPTWRSVPLRLLRTPSSSSIRSANHNHAMHDRVACPHMRWGCLE